MRALLALLLALLVAPAMAQDADVQIGLADDAIVISSGFAGTDVVVFGTVEGVDRDTVKRGDFDVVVVLAGPRERVTVREKQRRAGIWINGSGVRFANVPSSYSIATSAPLEQIAAPDILAPLHVGFSNVDARLVGVNEDDDAARIARYKASLFRLKRSAELYRERIGGVEFLNPTLFRARLDVPANVPIGHHRARAYLFRDGGFITTRSVLLEVRKSGLEQGIYDLAYRNGLLYGLLAVLIAIVTGWTASVVLRKD